MLALLHGTSHLVNHSEGCAEALAMLCIDVGREKQQKWRKWQNQLENGYHNNPTVKPPVGESWATILSKL